MNTQNEKQLTRGCGVLMPVSSLPSAYGIGTIGRAAYDFVDLLVDLKFRYWQILPIGPTSFGNSPYQALSAFAGNNYYIDLDELVNEGLLDIDEVRAVDWGSDERDVDYSSIYQNRNGVLKKAFKRFDRELVEYRIFKSDNRYWLDDYALFRALKDKHNGAPWIEWSREFRERDELALNVAREELAEETEFYIMINPAWSQYLHIHYNILMDFAYWNLTLFLQTRNPNVPAIPSKLIRPEVRSSLNVQHKYWDTVMSIGGPIKCIYTGRELYPGDYDLDHFIPWSFVSHDLLWNLIPSDGSVNSSKSNKIPDVSFYLPKLAMLHHKSLQIMIAHGVETKVMEDYLSLGHTSRELADMDNDHFRELYERTFNPLSQIALNMGFETWKY